MSLDSILGSSRELILCVKLDYPHRSFLLSLCSSSSVDNPLQMSNQDPRFMARDGLILYICPAYSQGYKIRSVT
jgi:hypothetical protein